MEPSSCRKHCSRLEPQHVFAASGDLDALAWIEVELAPDLKEMLIAVRVHAHGF